MKKYVDSCVSLEILKQDSGLLTKPSDNWNTFEPVEGDYAKVGGQDYQFVNGEWVEVEAESDISVSISSESTATNTDPDILEASTHAGAWFEAAYPTEAHKYRGNTINPHRERAKQLKEAKHAGTSV